MMQQKSSKLEKMNSAVKGLEMRSRLVESWHVLVFNNVWLFVFLKVTQKYHTFPLPRIGNTYPGWFLFTETLGNWILDCNARYRQ